MPDTVVADARHWHLLFAWLLVFNGFAYLSWSLFSRHLQRDIVPTADDIHAIPRSLADHIKLKHPTGEAAKPYDPFQRLASRRRRKVPSQCRISHYGKYPEPGPKALKGELP
jgi:thiosulfate reductase cytochrome b subunit